jgi:hypothetical protein
MFNFPSREDYDSFFFDPDGEIEAQQMREFFYDNYEDRIEDDDIDESYFDYFED